MQDRFGAGCSWISVISGIRLKLVKQCNTFFGEVQLFRRPFGRYIKADYTMQVTHNISFGWSTAK